MSILETPRILFRGEIAWDPIVTNNYPSLYDEEKSDRPVFPPPPPPSAETYRSDAIETMTQIGNWNIDGTHRSTFYSCGVTAVDSGDGPRREDPLVGSAVNFTGMLVDLEPFGSYSSQLFFDRLLIGVAGGYMIECRRHTRATARYINFARNPANNMIAGVASVNWQTAFPWENLTINAVDSRVLASLDTAYRNMKDVAGLTVRFNAYFTHYFDDPELSNGSDMAAAAFADLQRKKKKGGFQPNPARSLIVGAIGLWRAGEPVHEPGDRALLPTGQSVPTISPVPGFGAAFARLSDDGKKLSLDLSNAIPEQDRLLTKVDIRTLTINATDPTSGKAETIGALDYAHYCKAAYEDAGGVAVLALDTSEKQNAAAAGDLSIATDAGQVLLQETALRVVPATPNLYVDQHAGQSARFDVYFRGAPATQDTSVALYFLDANGNQIGSETVTARNGSFEIPVTSAASGITAIVPCPNDINPPAGGLNTQVNNYMYVRVLDADEKTGSLPPTWDNVYKNVLINWKALAPCMDNWLDLENEAQVREKRELLKRLTDGAWFESFRFMPVTRDMTAGERKLLHAFLDAPAGQAVTLAVARDAQAASKRARLSRAMRKPQV